ncbi:MAG: PIG-L family deacetylase [Ferruginibacter sp.]
MQYSLQANNAVFRFSFSISTFELYKSFMKKFPFLLMICWTTGLHLIAQTPKTFSAADILQDIKKLEVFGSVLYIAAHPDDENTRLLSYLANEKHYRTGYLSLTRGDGGQNLIGNEQGIDLGLIRTQELLSARRIDGAEQFFSRAYDFGYSKSPEEALRTWGHDKILSDVVWVIRKFRPDVMISRFPTTGEGGHGHHTASALLAAEAFEAAADPSKFPEQLKYVTPWQAKRLLWNTFNFGNTNTTRDDQFKMDVGMFNPVLGKSYGEMAAESRSRHRSQGFGVPAQRGRSLEYFSAVKGAQPVSDLMEGIDITAGRSGLNIAPAFSLIRKKLSFEDPAVVLPDLIAAYAAVEKMPDGFWKNIKQAELKSLIEKCSGIFLEAIALNRINTTGDSMKIRVTANNRAGATISAISVKIGDSTYAVGKDKNAKIILTQLYLYRQTIKDFNLTGWPIRSGAEVLTCRISS